MTSPALRRRVGSYVDTWPLGRKAKPSIVGVEGMQQCKQKRRHLNVYLSKFVSFIKIFSYVKEMSMTKQFWPHVHLTWHTRNVRPLKLITVVWSESNKFLAAVPSICKLASTCSYSSKKYKINFKNSRRFCWKKKSKLTWYQFVQPQTTGLPGYSSNKQLSCFTAINT